MDFGVRGADALDERAAEALMLELVEARDGAALWCGDAVDFALGVLAALLQQPRRAFHRLSRDQLRRGRVEACRGRCSGLCIMRE